MLSYGSAPVQLRHSQLTRLSLPPFPSAETAIPGQRQRIDHAKHLRLSLKAGDLRSHE
jgi:hypothetical protein